MSQDESLQVRHAPWSVTLGRVSGIPLRVHATFLLLLLWVASEGSSYGNALGEVLFALGLFGCVLLHELGHALVAKRFGILTRDITLYPFGGIASLAGHATPWSELWIALAGPAVNIVIAALLAPFVDWTRIADLTADGDFTSRLLGANLFLAIFNMIPAIPMDGGRVLRALLSLLKVRSATTVASRLSQIISAVLGIFALYSGNPILVIIAAFVFLNAMQELMLDRARLGAEGRTVREVMIERDKLQMLAHGMTLTAALDVALRSTQPAFPVLLGDQVTGVISREALLQEAAVAEDESYISGLMDRDFIQVSPGERVQSLVTKIEQDPRGPIIVLENGVLAGMVYREKLFEFLYLQGIRRARAEHLHRTE